MSKFYAGEPVCVEKDGEIPSGTYWVEDVWEELEEYMVGSLSSGYWYVSFKDFDPIAKSVI